MSIEKTKTMFDNKKEDINIEDVNVTLELMKSTPSIDPSIYDDLPVVFEKLFNNDYSNGSQRKKDIMLLSVLTTTSSLFPSVSFNYYDSEYFCNLYFFLTGKSGQGKSLLMTGQDILKVQKEKEVLVNEQIERDNTSDLIDWKSKPAKERGPKPKWKKDKEMEVNANTSASALLDHMENGTSLMFDQEADTLAKNMKQDWGDYGTTLRKSFEHESEKQVRKSDPTINIEVPKFSICISGTLNQAFTILLSNVENGLFNRFINYVYAEEPEFKSGRPSKKNKYKTKKEYFGNVISPMIQDRIDKINNISFEIEFNNDSWDLEDRFLKQMKTNSLLLTEKDITGVINRLGTITMRIAAIFTIFRTDRIDPAFPTLYCETRDMINAIKISQCLFNHSVLLMESSIDEQQKLTKTGKPILVGKAIYNEFGIGNTFTKQQAVNICEKIEIDDRACGRALNILIKSKKIERVGHGVYKIKKK